MSFKRLLFEMRPFPMTTALKNELIQRNMLAHQASSPAGTTGFGLSPY
jgi:hypothetical protein